MILPNGPTVRFIAWMAERLGLVIDLRDEPLVDPPEENEISEQLHHGRG